MRPSTRISSALAAVAVLGLAWFASAHSRKKDASDVVTLTGVIEPATFLAMKDRLVNSRAADKTFLVTYSGGGDWASALGLGILIHRHGWNVEIVDICASSCANFIFPAGKTKRLHRNSMLLFHGGPHQANLLERAITANQTPAVNGVSTEAKGPDHSNMEGNVGVDDKGPLRLQVWAFLGVRPTPKAEDLIAELTSVSDQFYQDLGVTPQLPIYGQTGRYENLYKAYKYDGFMYRLDSLRAMGVGNIELTDGEWQPEFSPAYPQVYEVSYP